MPVRIGPLLITKETTYENPDGWRHWVFQQSQDLLTAIKDLIGGICRVATGGQQPLASESIFQAQQARRTLMTFVRALHTLMQEAQQGELNLPLVGV